MDTTTKAALLDKGRAIVARLVEIQRNRKLSDRRLIDEYPDLGSAKTWKERLVTGTFEGLNLERTVAKLKRIEAILDGGSPDELFFPDSPFALQMRARVGLLERQTNDRRILACLAANGCGKSSYTRWCVAQASEEGKQRAWIRVRPTWRNKPLHLCLGIARALGREVETTNPAEAEEICLELLRGQARTLFIDQAHEGGVTVMHLLRGFVDETPSRFVYLAYATAFRRVMNGSTDALLEAKAFMGRCLKPTFDAYERGTLPEDVTHYLIKVGGLSKDVAAATARQLVPTLQAHTNLRLLDDAITATRMASEDDEAAPDQIIHEVYRLAGMDPKQALAAKEE